MPVYNLKCRITKKNLYHSSYVRKTAVIYLTYAEYAVNQEALDLFLSV